MIEFGDIMAPRELPRENRRDFFVQYLTKSDF